MLYFMQGGKSLYSGKTLEINELSTYEIDHIIPRSYIKDDSLDNKALVLREENQRKLDSLLLDDGIRRSQKAYWRALHDAKLISDKKFNNLMRSSISEKAMRGFINRQLVETCQIVKYVRLMLEERYADTKIVSIKAGITHGLREACDFVKCREINDYHHAHDAYLACQVGRFVQGRYPALVDEPVKMTKILRKYVQAQSAAFARTRKTPGSAGFIVDSFLKPNFNMETGELYSDGIVWNADEEIARIRKSLDLKDCFISRMPEETRGAFWDATIYSPRSGKNLGLPLKEGLDPRKYGSYSREQFAYFFIYEAREPKKGKHILAFEPVPVRIAASIEKSDGELERYARILAEEAGTEFLRIRRRKIYKYQLIELEGERFYITGKREVRNATAFSFSQCETRIMKQAIDGDSVDELQLDLLFKEIREKCARHATNLMSKLKIDDDFCEAFSRLSSGEKKLIVGRIVSIANAQTNMVDMTLVGGVANAGVMCVTFSKQLMKHGITFIDRSVTGMFERRTHIGL